MKALTEKYLLPEFFVTRNIWGGGCDLSCLLNNPRMNGVWQV